MESREMLYYSFSGDSMTDYEGRMSVFLWVSSKEIESMESFDIAQKIL